MENELLSSSVHLYGLVKHHHGDTQQSPSQATNVCKLFKTRRRKIND